MSVPGAQLAWDISSCTQWASGYTAEGNQEKCPYRRQRKEAFLPTNNYWKLLYRHFRNCFWQSEKITVPVLHRQTKHLSQRWWAARSDNKSWWIMRGKEAGRKDDRDKTNHFHKTNKEETSQAFNQILSGSGVLCHLYHLFFCSPPDLLCTFKALCVGNKAC